MAHKSHRLKALNAQLEPQPEISLITASSSKVSASKSKSKSKSKKTSAKAAVEEEAEMDVDGADTADGFESTWASGSRSGAADDEDDEDDEMLISTEASAQPLGSAIKPSTSAPSLLATAPSTASDPISTSGSGFAPLSAAAQAAASSSKNEFRRVPIPAHRMSPLKREWPNLYTPMVEMLGLQVRMNVKRRAVEMRTSKHTADTGSIQKGADFVKAFALGFDVNDALALLRLDDLYLDSFEIKDVKSLHGDHLSRAIGRIAGEGGKVKFAIENASRTRIVLAETHIHILGSVQNIKIARDAVVSLILGSPPGKVYAHLKTVGARMKQRF